MGFFQILLGAIVCLITLNSSTGLAQAPGETTAGKMETRSSIEEIPSTEWGEDYQIRAFGENPRARVMFTAYANALREDFRGLIYRFRPGSPNMRDSWAVPILIELWGKSTDVYLGDEVRTFVEIRPDNRFMIKVSVKLHDDFAERNFRLEVIRALILDQMLTPYISRPGDAENLTVRAPEWMVHGFDQIIEHRRGGRPSAIYGGVIKSGQVLKPDELFAEEDPDELDPINYAIFRTSAAAMVEALLDQPEGDRGFRSILADLAGSGPRSIDPLLRQHFPAFREMDQGLQKWWMLQMATLGQQQSFEFMGREETEHWLTEALTVRFDGEEKESEEKKKSGFLDRLLKKPSQPASLSPFEGTIEQFPEFLKRPGADEKLAQCFDKIQNLKRSAFPLYRPLFTRYEMAINNLIKRDTENLGAELASISELRTRIRETLVQAEDYLNYFEATRAPQRSKAFDDYLRMRKQLEGKSMPARDDRISRYLDALELEFR